MALLYPAFTDEETDSGRLSDLPKVIQLGKQQSQDSNSGTSDPGVRAILTAS